ncbi:MAG: hypothetical protein IT249_02700 [Chitinophagaceae bacterium]|nr:hypothetical protein [Chitinophagaceae bacterium]
MKWSKLLLFVVAIWVLMHVSNKLPAQSITARQVVGKYKNLFTQPPAGTPSNVSVDGPLLGNGYVAAVLAGTPDKQVYYFSRNDFWRLKSGFNESFPAVLGKLQILAPDLKDASYMVEQDLYSAYTTANFKHNDAALRITSTMAATKDILLIDVTNTGSRILNVQAILHLPETDQFHVNPPAENKFSDTVANGNDDGIQWLQRGFVKDVDIPVVAAVALSIQGNKTGHFSIAPGKTVTLVCAFSGSFKTKDCLNAVQQQLKHINAAAIAQIRREHSAWWTKYWEESCVSIDDSLIEQQYYKSQYNMASCSRDPEFPPGIFGSWVTKEMPAWNGDYHLNYNYSAPFYALYSSNHLQQALAYEAPLLQFLERGKYYSQKITGIAGGSLYPVGIGPKGMETTRKNNILTNSFPGYIANGDVEDEGLFFGQKSNAAYCVVNLSMQFYRTYDVAFTKRVYPFVKSVAVFWQHYLQKENDHYSIVNDAIHEGTIGTKNPILSLGLVPMVLKTAEDMSLLLAVDEDLRKDWKNKADSLAPFPVQERNGKTVFRYSEKGTAWWNDNTLGIQHIYPAGQIGLESDPELLNIARNTIAEMNRWKDMNGSNSFFPAAVRVGYDADTILQKLREYALHTYPNGFQLNNPHGIENCSTVPNTINEMLCMSNQGLLRVFAVWPKERDAFFSKIRSEGAFLVSSAVKNGAVQYVKIVSEKNHVCHLQNPWPGKTVLVKSNKRAITKKSGAVISLALAAGEEVVISVL